MTRETINAEKAPAAVGPYCHAVKTGNLVFTSGQLGLDPKEGTLPEGVEAQADQALTNLNEVLKASGLSLDNVIKTTVFLDDINDFAAINAVYEKRFGENKPARSCVEVAALPKGALFEIEAIAVAE
ncbi:RidA family protein [Anaerostipes sp.]|uniref:RidA family protein n=1 Tax=Anaerostipes sp. TaxID=1872530 RepID=UPI0025BCECBA|nr:RidA family protein [Anaerostipes sp.]MBS7007654.1 RidA family protein [Anaerostipes sp.]